MRGGLGFGGAVSGWTSGSTTEAGWGISGSGGSASDGDSAPSANGRAQLATAVVETGGRAYIGGAFTKMVPPGGGSSVTRNRLAALDVDRRSLLPWHSNANGVVRALALNGSKTGVYVGGDFSAIGGKAASKLALVDLGSGRVDPRFRPAVKGRVRSIALAGGRLYVGGGDFTRVGGSARAKVAALDAATGAALSKQWKVGRPLFGLTVWPGDGRTVFAAAGGPGGRIYAFDPDRPTKPKWQAAVDGDAVSVAASTTHAFLLGHYDYIVPKGSTCYQSCPNGTSRRHLAAFDAATGRSTGGIPGPTPALARGRRQ